LLIQGVAEAVIAAGIVAIGKDEQHFVLRSAIEFQMCGRIDRVPQSGASAQRAIVAAVAGERSALNAQFFAARSHDPRAESIGSGTDLRGENDSVIDRDHESFVIPVYDLPE